MSDWQSKLPRFIHPYSFQVGDVVDLESGESHHAVHVLRLKEGETLLLTNGQGLIGRAAIRSLKKKKVVLEILETQELPLRCHVRLSIGISKGPALETAIRRCTELGVAGFQPLVTQHSLSAKNWNAARWEKVIHEVSKQCQASHFARLYPPIEIGTWLGPREENRKENREKNLLVFCSESDRKRTEIRNGWLSSEVPSAVDLLIGPEGGWSEEEIKAIKSVSPIIWGLGPNRLRVETASIVALTLLKAQLGELD